jgi:hypothetical protein
VLVFFTRKLGLVVSCVALIGATSQSATANEKSVVLTLQPWAPPHITYEWGGEPPHLDPVNWFEGRIVATLHTVIDPVHGLVADRIEVRSGIVRKMDNADPIGAAWSWTEFNTDFDVSVSSHPFGGSISGGDLSGTATAANTSTFDLAPIRYTLNEGPLWYQSSPAGWDLPEGTTDLAAHPVVFDLSQTATVVLANDGNGEFDVTLWMPFDGSALVDDGNGLQLTLGNTLEFTGTTFDPEDVPVAPGGVIVGFAAALVVSGAVVLRARRARRTSTSVGNASISS